MAVNIGPRIGIEGENEYRAELMKIIETQKTLNSEMKATQSAWDETTSAEKKAKDTADALNAKIKNQRDRVDQLKKAVEESTEKFGENSTKTLKWRQALADATTELNKLEAELKSIPTPMQLMGQKIQDFGDKMQKAGQKIQKAGQAMTSVGSTLSRYVTAPVLAAGTAAVKLASDYEENLNKVDSAFKGSSDVVKDWAKEATKNFGMSESAALDATSLFGDMATSMGLSTDEAAAMSTSLAGLAGDMSSFKNIDIKTAMTALKGVFTGETESLKGLGVVMTETNLKAFAEDMGLVYDEMTQAQKVTLRYKYVMQNTANAQGDYLRTSDGFANSIRTLKAETSNLGAAFGKELLPYITPLVQKATELVKSFGNLSETEKQAIIRTAGLAAAAGPLITVGGKLTTGIGKIVEKGGQLVEWTGKVAAGQATISSTAAAAGAGIGALAAFAAMAYIGYKDLEKGVREANTELYESIDAVEGTNAALDSATSGLTKGMEDAKKAIDDVESSAQAATKIADQIEELTSKTSLTADEQARLKVLVAEMNQLFPEMGLAIDDVSGALNMSNTEIRKFIQNEHDMAKAAAYSNAVKESLKAMAEAELAVAKAQIERDNLQEQVNASQAEYDAIVAKNTASIDKLTGADRELAEMSTQVQGATNGQKMALNDANEALTEQKKKLDDCSTAQAEAQKEYDLNRAALEKLANSLGVTVDELLGMNDASEETEIALEDLGGTTEEAADEIDKATQEIIDSYNQTYESAKESVLGQTDLWDELEKQEKTSIGEMRKNLQAHNEALRNWNSNASKLMSSTQYQTDVNFRAMVDSIVSAGMDMAPELQALVDAFEAGDEELAGITADYGETKALAETFSKNTASAKTSAEYGLQAMNEAFKQEGDKLVKNAKTMMSDTGDAIQNYDLGKPTTMAVRTIGKAVPEAKKQGKGIADGGTTGVKDGQPGFEKAASGAGGSAVQQMASAIKNAEAKTRNAANDIYNGVSSVFGNLASQGKTWGGHLGEGFAQGLASQANSIWNQARTIAQGVKNILGHSTPKEGPLHGDDVWGEHLAQNFASGMIKGVSGVKEAAMDLAAAAVLPTRTLMNIDAVSGRNVAEPLTVNDIYDAFSAAISEQETKIVIGNREFGRILRDQGVA